MVAAMCLSLLSACGSSPAAATTSATATSTASASSTPSSTPTNYRVVVTSTTVNGSQIFLYDSATNAPQQLAELPPGAPPLVRFVQPQKIAYTQATSATATEIVSMDLSTHTAATEITAAGQIPAFAYSHDGSILAYLVHDTSGKASLHTRRNGHEATLTLNPIPGRGVTRDDEVLLQFSPDDQYLLMVDTYVGNEAQAPQTGQFLVLRTADNTVAFVPPSGVSSDATMATWASQRDRLFYRDQIGVRTWDAGATSVGTLATALHWYDPAVSADDRYIAYTALDTHSVPHVLLYDLQSKQSHVTVATARSHPIFMTSSLLWDLEEQPCQSECLGGPSQPTGKLFAYSVSGANESGLPFSDVQSLWQSEVFGR